MTRRSCSIQGAVRLAALALALAGPATALAELTRRPYLQNGSASAVSIRWRTEDRQQQPGLVRHHARAA